MRQSVYSCRQKSSQKIPRDIATVTSGQSSSPPTSGPKGQIFLPFLSNDVLTRGGLAAAHHGVRGTVLAPFWSHRRNTVTAGTAKEMGLAKSLASVLCAGPVTRAVSSPKGVWQMIRQ